MTILEEIIRHKKIETGKAMERVPVGKLEKSKNFIRPVLSMTEYITRPDKTGIIAEFKRKSPSKGILNSVATVEEVTTGYFRAGASAISVLTDKKFFGGSASDLSRTRQLNPIPILRKDFIINEYQIIEARSMGADAILLIAAALDKSSILKLARFARSLQLQVLFEVHDKNELGMLNEYVNIVGVNNRDLNTFKVDTERSVEMAYDIPSDFVRISESGITSPLTIKKLRGCGYQGFLIGESFMRSPEPAAAFSDFVRLIMCEYD